MPATYFGRCCRLRSTRKRARIELITRLELLSRSVINGIRNLTLAEAYARYRSMQEKGGGWPRASGHLTIIGHAL